MAKYCPNCGKQADDNAVACSACGTNFNQGVNVNVNLNGGNMGGRPVVKERGIVVAIILSIVTCGIYGIYWFIMLTEEANTVSGDHKTSGGMAFLFTILTCGIYGIYWYYKQGKKLYDAGQKYGMNISDNSVVYLLLGIFGLGIISYCMMQSELNKFSA